MTRYQRRVKYESTETKVKKQFDIVCKECGSKEVYFDYEREGGYSEYTQWGSHVTFGCNTCKQNDLLL